jgi:hypothetical protein
VTEQTEPGSDEQMTDEQRAEIERRLEADREAQRAEDALAEEQPTDGPG